MKRMYIALAILAAVIAICTAVLICTDRIADDMSSAVDSLRDSDDELLQSRFAQIQSDWTRRRKILSLYTRHSEVEKISDCMAVMDGYLRAGNYDMLRYECVLAQEAIEHLRDSEHPTVYNIM